MIKIRRFIAGALPLVFLLALALPVAATVNTSANKTIAAGNGSNTQFQFTFIGVASAYISVTYTDPSGNQTVLTQGSGSSQYQITLNAPVQGAIWGQGGTVTYNPGGTPIPAGSTLTIYRTLPLTQAITLQNQTSVQTLGKGAETAVDTAVMEGQQTAEMIGRALQMNPSNTSPPATLPPAAMAANMALCFDGTGNNVVACALPSSGVISSAMQPVVDAASLALGRTAFGLGTMAAENIDGGTCGGTTLQDDGSGNARVVFATVVDSTNQSVTCAFHGTQRLASGTLVYTLPLANTSLFNGFEFSIFVLSGSATIVPNASDNFYGQSSGSSIVVRAGSKVTLKTNATSPGAVWYASTSALGASGTVSVTEFGADPTGTNDSSAAFNSAAAALPSGGQVFVPRGNYKLSSILTTITTTGIQFQCESEQSTFLQRNVATGNLITFEAQYGSVRDCSFLSLVRPTSGYEVSFNQGCFECEARNVAIQYGFNGIEVFNATETHLLNVDLRYLFGSAGIYEHGTTGNGSFGLTVTKVTTDNPYPAAIGSVFTWATNTSVTAGQVTNVNGFIYQAATGGTTAATGSGPSGLPSGSTPASAFVNTIADGSVTWNYVNSDIQWGVQDSFGYSWRCSTCAFLDGLDGFAAVDTVNSGSSYPKFNFFDDIETDHSFADGVILNAGVNFSYVNSWFGSSLSANGIHTASNFKGELAVSNSRIAGNCQYGILLAAGKKSVVSNNTIATNSVCSSGTYDGVGVAVNLTQFIVTNNFLGQDSDLSSDGQNYGVIVNTGTSDYYTITGNICGNENVTGCVSDGGSGSNKTVSGNH